ncbi:hypothetical protein RINTU1_33260 [Candidatus Regiella insecticola]|uniref:Uncharacterized protein n=1 Tax=Candidatus Regiella insecticola TaxID=138073 RepID=A0A6L2ZR97_9ENTR|nr:hypothetical protein RINTU1_33260 [Candidatus Regiella insecticola]
MDYVSECHQFCFVSTHVFSKSNLKPHRRPGMILTLKPWVGMDNKFTVLTGALKRRLSLH